MNREGTPLGAFVANTMSALARGLGIVLFGILIAIYHRDRRAIAIIAAVVVAAGLLLWWLL